MSETGSWFFFLSEGNRLLSGEVKVPGGWARMMIFLPTCAFYFSLPEFLLVFSQSRQEDSSQMEPILLEGKLSGRQQGARRGSSLVQLMETIVQHYVNFTSILKIGSEKICLIITLATR